jgi:nucleotide-binding universal stress UspA family protein
MKYLVGFDGSNSGKEAINLAKSRAKLHEAQILVVVSMVKGSDNDEIAAKNQHLIWAKKELEEAGLACETQLLIRGHSPGEDLVLFARENSVDEIIVGVKRRSKVGKLLMGSTAQHVILEAHCPVTTVK